VKINNQAGLHQSRKQYVALVLLSTVLDKGFYLCQASGGATAWILFVQMLENVHRRLGSVHMHSLSIRHSR
jgi:hypothetical protein